MKQQIFNILRVFGVCALLGTSSLSAQSSHMLIATVPFDFAVNNQHLASGTYTVTINNALSTLLIRGEENGSAMYTLTNATEPGKVPDRGKLIFNRYGDRYFLSQVWYPEGTQGRGLPASKAEQELARNTGRPAVVALLASGSQPHKPVR